MTFANAEEERSARENIVRRTLEVEAHNALYAAKKVNYMMAVYKWDYLPQEVLDQRNGVIEEKYRRKRALVDRMQSFDTCSSSSNYMNWVDLNKVNSIQDQGYCGSCTIFAGTAVIESALAIKYGLNANDLKLSEQQSLECYNGGIGVGCSGGTIWNFWDLTEPSGLVNTIDYNPYTAYDKAMCNNDLPRVIETEIDYILYSSTEDEEALKCYIDTYGPVAVAMVASEWLSGYGYGIFDDPYQICNGKSRDHAVAIVGYGSEYNNMGYLTDYWLVRNSFGSGWGLDGYFKIARNMQNLCQIASEVHFPVLKCK